MFLHPRNAIEEPNKVVKPEFRFKPSLSSSPRAQTDGGSLRHENQFSKSGWKLWSAVRGQRENRSFILCANTLALFKFEYSNEQTVRMCMLTRAGANKIITSPLPLPVLA